MDTLPDELIVLILEDLLVQLDIQCIRLVSRRYASLALQFLLTKAHFFLRRNSLSRLQHIADHPVLCRTLRDVTFMVDVAPRFADIEQWREQAQGYCQGPDRRGKDAIAKEWLVHYSPFELVPMAKSGMPSSFLTAGWKHQLAMVCEQDDLRSASTLSRLEHTLRKFINLHSFTIDGFEDYHRDLMRQLYVSQHSQVWYCWNRTRSHAGDDYNAAQLFATALAISLPAISNGFRSLPTPSSAPGTISVLNVEVVGRSLCQNVCNEIASTASEFELIGQSSLRSLSFRTKYENESQETLLDPTEVPEGLASLSTFLSSITNLEQLSLDVIEDTLVRSEDIFKNNSWRNLSELCVSYIDIHQVSFQDFLQSHATKLKTLKIRGANLRNDSSERLWGRMLQFLATQLQLSIFELEGPLDENHEIELDLDNCWTAPGGHTIRASLIAQYLVVGDSKMDENDKLTIANLGHDVNWSNFEAVVYPS